MAINKSYVPHSNISYPEYTDQHYLKVLKDDGTVFDKDYPYIDNSKSFKFKRFWVRVLLYLIVFPLSYIRFGLKIRGRRYLRKNKKILKQGALSICNHVHMWDYIMIMNAIKPVRPYLLSWKKNVSGESGPLVRLVGGIPIPENDPQATVVYLNTIRDLLSNGGWLHIYPEGSMWEYYRLIRPFKKGVAHLARMTNKPIVPFGISYRRPNWFRRVFLRQKACYNLCCGEPIFINENLSPQEQEVDLLKRCHEAVNNLVGLTEFDNPYEPIFNNTKRIDF